MEPNLRLKEENKKGPKSGASLKLPRLQRAVAGTGGGELFFAGKGGQDLGASQVGARSLSLRRWFTLNPASAFRRDPKLQAANWLLGAAFLETLGGPAPPSLSSSSSPS